MVPLACVIPRVFTKRSSSRLSRLLLSHYACSWVLGSVSSLSLDFFTFFLPSNHTNYHVLGITLSCVVMHAIYCFLLYYEALSGGIVCNAEDRLQRLLFITPKVHIRGPLRLLSRSVSEIPRLDLPSIQTFSRQGLRVARDKVDGLVAPFGFLSVRDVQNDSLHGSVGGERD